MLFSPRLDLRCRARALPLAGLVLLLGACNGRTVDAPEPPRDFSKDPETFPAAPAGTIVAPLSLDMKGAAQALEQEVPRKFGDITKRTMLPGSKRKSFAFEVRREPFTVAFRHDTILLSSVMHYRGRGWYNPPIGPDINGECGTDETPPRARLTVRVVPGLGEDWHLKVKTRLADVTPLTLTDRDQCKVSFLNYDVTDRVLEAARGALRRVLPSVDRRLALIDVQTPLEKIWWDLQQPIRLQDGLWLVLAPESVHLGEIGGKEGEIGAQIGIRAAPRIMSGKKPVVGTIPLPPLQPVTAAEGFSVMVEGSFGYAAMGDELTKRFQGKKVQVSGGEMEIKHVRVTALGGGRLGLGVDFEGTAKGRLWFSGTPQYDTESQMITVPDLDFDATSAGMLVQGIAWIKGDMIREFLRAQAQFSAAPLLERLKALATKEMNRTLAKGVVLHATIDGTEPAGIAARANALVLRARASGSAQLELGPEIFAPKG